MSQTSQHERVVIRNGSSQSWYARPVSLPTQIMSKHLGKVRYHFQTATLCVVSNVADYWNDLGSDGVQYWIIWIDRVLHMQISTSRPILILLEAILDCLLAGNCSLKTPTGILQQTLCHQLATFAPSSCDG